MKYSWKGHKNRYRHKSRVKKKKKKEWASSIGLRQTQTRSIPTTWRWTRGADKEVCSTEPEIIKEARRCWSKVWRWQWLGSSSEVSLWSALTVHDNLEQQYSISVCSCWSMLDVKIDTYGMSPLLSNVACHLLHSVQYRVGWVTSCFTILPRATHLSFLWTAML